MYIRYRFCLRNNFGNISGMRAFGLLVVSNICQTHLPNGLVWNAYDVSVHCRAIFGLEEDHKHKRFCLRLFILGIGFCHLCVCLFLFNDIPSGDKLSTNRREAKMSSDEIMALKGDDWCM